jgi:hypothetical protein
MRTNDDIETLEKQNRNTNTGDREVKEKEENEKVRIEKENQTTRKHSKLIIKFIYCAFHDAPLVTADDSCC